MSAQDLGVMPDGSRHKDEVVAIEPAVELRSAAQRHPENKGILWVDDQLPDITRTTALGRKYDLILVSAVWMHIPDCARERAFRKLGNLLNPGGKLVITLRHGDFSDERIAYPVSAIELKQLATKNVLQLIMENQSPDRMVRRDVSWETIIFQRQNYASLLEDRYSCKQLFCYQIINVLFVTITNNIKTTISIQHIT